MNLYKLREAEAPYSDISIAHDLTLAEREELKGLVAEAKDSSIYDMSGKWEYKVRSRGPRWDPKIVKLKKRGNVQKQRYSDSEGEQMNKDTEVIPEETRGAEGGPLIS